MDNPFIVEVGDEAVQLSGASNQLKGRIIRNLGGTSVFLGGSAAVEADNTNDLMGWELPSETDFTDTVGRDQIWAISAESETNDVQIWEAK